MARRSYSDKERAEALAVLDSTKKGGVPNYSEASRLAGVPRKTIEEWDKGRVNSDVAEIRQHKKGELADCLSVVAHELVEAIGGKIAEASLQQVATSMGIVVDKMQLLRGEPTSISQSQGMNDDERAERVAALLERARARRDGPAPDGQPAAVAS